MGARRDLATQLAYEACKYDLPLLLVQKLPLLEFESRKDAAQVVGAIVRLDSAGDNVGVRFVLANPQMLKLLFEGCAVAATALCVPACGRLRCKASDHMVANDCRFWSAVHGSLKLVMLTVCWWCRYDNADIALNCGSVLRDCIKDHQIAE